MESFLFSGYSFKNCWYSNSISECKIILSAKTPTIPSIVSPVPGCAKHILTINSNVNNEYI